MTGNVTWLSPAACDPGKRAADMPQGTRSGGQAMRVLVTEDDEILATAVAAGLRREGMAVDVALDGAAALERLAVNRYDVVVLDRDLPGVHGDDVCRALAARQIRNPGADAHCGEIGQGTGRGPGPWRR